MATHELVLPSKAVFIKIGRGREPVTTEIITNAIRKDFLKLAGRLPKPNEFTLIVQIAKAVPPGHCITSLFYLDTLTIQIIKEERVLWC